MDQTFEAYPDSRVWMALEAWLNLSSSHKSKFQLSQGGKILNFKNILGGKILDFAAQIFQDAWVA
jgi:hypothetical protein